MIHAVRAHPIRTAALAIVALAGTVLLPPSGAAGTTADTAPRGIMGYAISTTTVSSTGSETAIPGLTDIVSVPATDEARCLRVSTSLRFVSSMPNTTADVYVRRDGVGSPVQSYSLPLILAGGAGGESIMLNGTDWVSPGTHTYRVSFRRTAGSGTVYAEQTAGQAKWLMIEDVGANTPCGNFV